jgi:hypothetical protein
VSAGQRCPQCHEGDPVVGPVNGVVWCECQHCGYVWRDESPANPPGLSPVYAIARDMLDALARGDASAHHWSGALMVRVVDGGNYRAVTIDDDTPLHPDTLALWAAAFGQPVDGWLVDSATGGRVARLEWATDGETLPGGGGVTWIGGKP